MFLETLKLNILYGCSFKLRFECIATLQYLKHLSITSAEFVSPKNKLSHHQLESLSRLEHLTHLNLYNCKPVDSTVLTHLSPACCGILEHLNLGLTDIDFEIIGQFSLLPRLTYLNVDETRLNGDDITRLCKHLPHPEHLKELSLWHL